MLSDPNPHQNGDQLFWTTHLWLSMRGRCLWVLTDEEGRDVPVGETPTRIWPMSPELFEPLLEHGQIGEQIGWIFTPTHYMKMRERGTRLFLPLHTVIDFKVPHPQNMLQSVSRIAATVMGVEQDLGLQEYNRSILQNNGEPGGVLMYDVAMTEEEKQEQLLNWESRYKGPGAANRVALLDAGMKYVQTALTPQDLQGREQMEWNRSVHSAVMGVPPSQLGVTEFTNYATALGQKKTLWDNTLLPQIMLVDRTLDSTLFFMQPDNVVGMHDLRDIEALRSGTTEKINAAKEMCGTELHATPRVAFETVGLEVEGYDLDEVALINGVATPSTDLLFDETKPPAPEPEPKPEEDPVDEAKALVKSIEIRIVTTKNRRWNQFERMQSPWEDSMRTRYLRWASAERRLTLARFDDAAKALTKQPGRVNLAEVLPRLEESAQALSVRVRPLYSGMLQDTFEFTIDDFGTLPVFGLDDERILSVFEVRQLKLLETVPKTVRNNLFKSLTTGINSGEGLDQLRKRIQEVYGVSMAPGKALTIARTETAGFMNSVRHEMFGAQGFSQGEWITAGDENVRPPHKVFGDAGPQDRGFNYLTLVNESGTLEHPNDPQGPVHQVANCRCIEVPVA